MTAAYVQERRDRVAQMWRDGMQAPDIAEELGESRWTVSMDLLYLRRSGEDIPRRKAGTFTDPKVDARKEQVAELRRQGYSGQEIADRLRVSLSKVRTDIRWLRADGTVAPHDAHSHPDRVARRRRVAELWLEGYGPCAIASIMDIARSTVYEDLDRCRAEGQELPYRKPSLAKGAR